MEVSPSWEATSYAGTQVRISTHLMEPESSLPFSQEHTTGTHPGPD
jgi:hypothetical protein